MKVAFDRVVVGQHLLGGGAVAAETEAMVGVGETGNLVGGLRRGEFAGEFEGGGGVGFLEALSGEEVEEFAVENGAVRGGGLASLEASAAETLLLTDA